MTTDKQSYDFGSDADYGRGSRGMKNELGMQLQKLANQGYLLLNIVHAEDKTDFATQRQYVGTSLSNSLYGVAEKFVDQIIYLDKQVNPNNGKVEHKIWFNPKGGFAGAGGRWTPEVDCIECSYKNLEKVMLDTFAKSATEHGVETSVAEAPSVVITQDDYDFSTLKKEFDAIVEKVMTENPTENAVKIKGCVEGVLGAGKKVGDLGPTQAELLSEILIAIKEQFKSA